MKSASNLWIVIPVHNRKAFTLECLESLAKQTVTDFSVAVIDDGSTDGTSQAVQEIFPEVHLIPGSGNLWWSGATNAGIRYAFDHGATGVITLNNDVVCTPDYVTVVVQTAKLHPRALLGSTVYDIDTKAQVYCGQVVNWHTGRFDGPASAVAPNLRAVTHLPGRGTFIPASVFARVGIFDERHLPQYGADYDLSMRAKAAGFETYCANNAVILSHSLESGSTQLVLRRSLRNYWRHLFGIKGGGNLVVFCRLAWRHCPRRFLPTFLIMGLAARIGGYPLAWAKELTSWLGCKRLFTAWIGLPTPLAYTRQAVAAAHSLVVRKPLRDRKRVFVNVNIDDFAPYFAARGRVDLGGKVGEGLTRDLKELLQDFPTLRPTLFVVPDLRLPWRIVARPGACITDLQHAAWLEYYKRLSRHFGVELALHGYHHVQAENPLLQRYVEFAFKDDTQTRATLQRAIDSFRHVGLPLTGFRPPGWGLNSDLSLLDAVRETPLSYIAASSPGAGLNEGRELVSNYYPTVIKGVLNLPQNVLLEWTKEQLLGQVYRIVNAKGLVSIKCHTRGTGSPNDLTQPVLRKLRWLLAAIDKTFGDAVEYVTLYEVSQFVWTALHQDAALRAGQGSP